MAQTMAPEAYRRMAIVGRLLIVLGTTIPMMILICTAIRSYDFARWALWSGFGYLSVALVASGAFLWAYGWIKEADKP